MVPVVCTCIVPCMVYIFEVSLAATCMRIKLGEKLGKRGTCNPDLFIGRQADAKKRHQHIRHTLKGTVPIISPVQQHSIHPASTATQHTRTLPTPHARHPCQTRPAANAQGRHTYPGPHGHTPSSQMSVYRLQLTFFFKTAILYVLTPATVSDSQVRRLK